MNPRINAVYLPDRCRYGLWLYVNSHVNPGDQALMTEHGLEPHPPGQILMPTIELDEVAAANLMTQLWAQGLRPKEWGHEGQVSALKDHLEDMRKLVFKEPK